MTQRGDNGKRPERSRQSKADTADTWWAFTSRILAFFSGAGVIVHETLADAANERPYLLAVGLGLMGPAVATTAIQVIQAVRGKEEEDDA